MGEHAPSTISESAVSIASSISGTLSAVVLLIAGIMKIGDLARFGQQIVAYQILPVRIARSAGYILPPAEVALGLSMLFVPRLAAVAVLLFLSFAFAIGVNIARGRTELRCGCFGASGKHTISRAHAAANVVLAALAALTFTEPERFSFIAFQVGVSLILFVLLALAWRSLKQPSQTAREGAET